MQILSKINNLFTAKKERKNLSLVYDGGFFLGLHRRSRSPLYFDRDSAFSAYRTHELVFGCINKIADVMNDAEIIVEEKNSQGEWEKKDGHLMAALFRRPNDFQTGRDIRRLLVQSEQSIGRCFIYAQRSKAGIPVSITVLNPNRVIAKINNTSGKVVQYEYLKNNGSRINLNQKDLIIRRRADLLDQFWGFAPLEAALKSINSDLGLTDYVDAFFESDGTPSGILKFTNATVNETTREATQAQWQKKYSRGGAHQKGVAVLDQNAEFQKIGSNLDELASDSLSGRFESRICAVFGVPPNLVGAYVGLLHVTANATARAELRNFWDNKISPELAGLREWLTWFVLPEFEDIEKIKAEKLRVGFDISQAAFLQEEINDIHTRARDNFKAGGWTLNEFREATDQLPDAKGDYYLQPINLLAASPENRAIEAFRRVDQEKEDDDIVVKENAITGELNGTGEKVKKFPPSEKKTFEFDGLILGREPSQIEKIISLKNIVSDFETEKERAVKILSRFRDDLIDQAVNETDGLAVETIYKLILVPDPKIRKQIVKAIISAYRRGRGQVIAELEAQRRKNTASSSETKDITEDFDTNEFLDELTDGIISRIINEIQTRAINAYLALKLLLDYTSGKLREKLTGESVKFIEQTAGNAVNAAIRAGRDDEMKDQMTNNEIDHFEYSAVLDANTCQVCEDADGQISNTPDDLPDAPNPDCEGGPNCRCFIVAVAI